MKNNVIIKNIIAVFSLIAFGLNAQIADFEYEFPCMGDTTYFINTSVYAGGIDSYEWKFGDGTVSNQVNPGHVYQNSGSYTVELAIYSNLILIDNKIRIVQIYNKPIADFNIIVDGESTQSFCVNDSISFQNNSSSEGDIENYFWDFGNGEGSIVEQPVSVFSKPGTFLVNLKITTKEGCSGTMEKEIIILELPVANIFAETTELCEGESVQLYVDGQFSDVLWSTGEYSEKISVSPESGKSLYQVTLYKAYYEQQKVCKTIDEIEIQVHSKPIVSIKANLYPDNIPVENNTISQGESVSLQLETTGSISEYDWTPVIYITDPTLSQIIATPIMDVEYKAEVTNIYGCKASASYAIYLESIKVAANDVVTPNSDGLNDNWEIENYQFFTSYKVYIYDRWGEEVFYKDGNYQSDWPEGSEKTTLPEGTYYYLLKDNNSDETYTGPITLLKTPQK